MKVKLLHNTPLWVCSTSIRKCWASEGKSDTLDESRVGYDYYIEEFGTDHSGSEVIFLEVPEAGEADKALIERVGNKNKHSSTLEHINYSFDIDGISRACLQELARHRHASLSVKSTRYTLKELKEVVLTHDSMYNYLVKVEPHIDLCNYQTLLAIQEQLSGGVSNDKIKFALPEAYKTSLVWTINARSLQNFLALRTNKSALWEIQELANEVFNILPYEHKYLFEDFIYPSE